MTSQVVLLAGGLGTRLRDVSADTPKPLMPVAGKPFIQHVIEEYRRFGYRRFLVLAGFRGDRMTEFFSARPIEGADVEVLVESQPKGTAGALREAQPQLEEIFLLANADSIFDINYLDFDRMPSKPDWLAKLALRWMDHADRYGVVELDGERIVQFRERGQSDRGLINGGIYLMRKAVVGMIDSKTTSLEGSVLPTIAAQGRLLGKVLEGSFIDIGTPLSFNQAQDLLNDILTRPIAFLCRDCLLSNEERDSDRIDQIRWVDGAKEAVKILNDTRHLVIVVAKQTRIAQRFGKAADVSLHDWMNSELRPTGAHVDAVYNSPYLPDGKSTPKFELTLQAMKDWSARKQGTFIVGHDSVELAAGRKAGITEHLISNGDLRVLINRIVGLQ